MIFELHWIGVLDTTELSSYRKGIFGSYLSDVSTDSTMRQLFSCNVRVPSVLSFTRASNLKPATTQCIRASKCKPHGSPRKNSIEDSRFKYSLESSFG